jgi:DNA (cytosine-5)-methyltransferase 1
LIREVQPEIVSMENVPQLLNFKRGPVIKDFVAALEESGYHVSYQVVYSPDYGIPQTRKRLVLLASKLGQIAFISPTHGAKNYVTVRDVIGDLPPVEQGGTSPSDALHKASGLSELNLARIRQSVPGGNWNDWDENLILECHRKNTGKTYSGVYGRMKWDEPAPTITTQFFGLGSGRFGHPEQDRALTLREGALLQTFPQDYAFMETEGAPPAPARIGKHIGNAVPVRLARMIAASIKVHLVEHGVIHKKYLHGKASL